MVKNFWKVHLKFPSRRKSLKTFQKLKDENANFWKVHFKFPNRRKSPPTFQKLCDDEKLLESSSQIPTSKNEFPNFPKVIRRYSQQRERVKESSVVKYI